MVMQKPDADEIRNFLASLERESWLRRTERRWWPRFVFHYTDLNNAAKILQDGYLYCRKHLEETNQLPMDSGSPIVLAGTADLIKEYVRLYFRPQTPTQYHVEGIRPGSALTELRAHCPTPVFFLFDSAEILTRTDCRFSDGNLAKVSPRARLLSTAAELQSLPWRRIYHTGPFNPDRESDITFRRNAEIIVPYKLDLDSLRFVYCRSEAEKETLLHLLSPLLRQEYRRMIVATTRSMLFFRQYTFVETAHPFNEDSSPSFFPRDQIPRPISFVCRYRGSRSSPALSTGKRGFSCKGGPEAKFSCTYF